MPTMIAARLHAYGQPMTLDRIEVPEPRQIDFSVRSRRTTRKPAHDAVIETC